MKKFLYIAALTGLVSFSSCADDALETNPTDEVSVEQIFGSADAAQTALNGIYRAMYVNGWSNGWESEEPGVMGSLLYRDLMGEDHLMADQGNGWFYYDYAFWTDSDYTGDAGRQYAQWSLYYTMISQVNYVIAQKDMLESYGEEGLYVLGQAYALRAFSYFWLYNIYCKGYYVENSDAPGVPLYTEPTTTTTQGKGRGTVADVFTQINADYKAAVDLFTEAGVEQKNPMNVDLYTTYALWARVALVQEDWVKAAEYANAALEKPEIKRVATISELGAFNDCTTPSVFWGFESIADQASPFGPFMCHMDLNGEYGSLSKQCIDAWLWHNIPTTDARKTAWFDNPEKPAIFPYGQLKYQHQNLATAVADIIYVRAEEMILIAAEAACRQEDWTTARELLTELVSKRDTDYETRLEELIDSDAYGDDTHGPIMTLMEEILFQRRVELWCEGMGRTYDLCRLNLGYDRDYEGSNHAEKIAMEPLANEFQTLLPQKEFDSNDQITIADQNPR